MRTAIISLGLAVSACAQPLEEYRPVVDPASSDRAAYEADLPECLAIADGLQREYRARASGEMWANIIVGALAGAALGGALDGASVGQGASVGATAGILADTPHGPDMVQYGPRRVVDRCMIERGHRVLNDPGRA